MEANSLGPHERTHIDQTQPPPPPCGSEPSSRPMNSSLRRRRGADSDPPAPPPKANMLPASARDWSALPLDVLVSIFTNVGVVDVVRATSLVCHSWLEAAKLPDLWRSVDLANHDVEKMDEDVLHAVAKAAVDRAKGQMEVFLGKLFVTDGLLMHIANWSTSLRRLSLISCHDVTNKGFRYLIAKCPLLEHLSLELCPRIGGHDIYEATGKACPQLKHFSLHRELFKFSFKYPVRYLEERGLEVMHELRSLSLVGSNISNGGLEAILDSCPHLETLFLRDCYNVTPNSALRAKCAGLKTVTFVKYKWVTENDGGCLRRVLRQCE